MPETIETLPPPPPATSQQSSPQPPPAQPTPHRGIRYGRLGWGLVLLVIGVAMLLERLDLYYFGDYVRYWPLILVALGGVTLAGARNTENRRSGAWLIAIGGWFLVNTLNLFGLWWGDSWPLIIIAAGVIDLLLPKEGENRLQALWPLGIGSWLLVTMQGWWGFSWDSSWPLLLIFLGAALVIQALVGRGRRPATGQDGNGK